MQSSNVRPYQKWRWAGDQIFHDTVIPASRTIPGTRIKNYPIDIRQFLSFSSNAIVGNAIKTATEHLPDYLRLRFYTQGKGHFDFRVDVLFEWLRTLKYISGKRRFDQWYFPEETLALGGGDCEDLAFLFAALLLQSGISSYCVRVALGSVLVHDISNPNKVKKNDHAWVVYQKESGGWEVFDPLARVQNPVASNEPQNEIAAEIEYVPVFVFNNHHLWLASTPEASATTDNLETYLNQRRFWKEFNPTFAASVHNNIFDEALSEMSLWDRLFVKSVSLGIDVNTAGYDPFDHFDSAYIDESWKRVQTRLATGNLTDFGLATHAVADFYAHSMYGEFSEPMPGNTLKPYDPSLDAAIQCKKPLLYDFSGLKLPDSKLNASDAAKHWNGKLISGQWFRWFAGYPSRLNAQRQDRQTLPDHDCIAVDSPTTNVANHYFVKNGTYAKQFLLRRQTAITHIREIYAGWSGR